MKILGEELSDKSLCLMEVAVQMETKSDTARILKFNTEKAKIPIEKCI